MLFYAGVIVSLIGVVTFYFCISGIEPISDDAYKIGEENIEHYRVNMPFSYADLAETIFEKCKKIKIGI